MGQKIAFIGASGTGKTTLAKWISEELEIPFISGSVSDIVPSTKDMLHLEMMDQETQPLASRNLYIVRAREKSINDHNSLVTDRSPLDAVAYGIDQLSSKVDKGYLDHLLNNAKDAMKGLDYLIFIPVTNQMVNNWEIEDNNKRVLNPWFQWKVSCIMNSILHREDMLAFFKKNHIKVISLYPYEIEIRKKLIKSAILPCQNQK